MDGALLQSLETFDASPFNGSGEMWERLQAEKEEVERDILGDGPLLREAAASLPERDPAIESDSEIEWRRRETLEGRLRDLNDAQDRLIDGGYGFCLECRDEIDPKRLAADPAASFCIGCQTLAEAASIRTNL